MCGFTGQFGGKQNSQEFFRQVLSLSQHRGPDQTGIWSDDYAQLGFNRLAIQDLSGHGDQPMASPSGRYMLVFNGEIYNHLRLRLKLSKAQFKGHGDTETICYALDQWGVDQTAVSLEGMFALAVYDRSTLKLHLIRDYAGIKPLFYGVRDDQCWFASQFNQVVKGLSKDKLNLLDKGMRDFLQLGYMQAPVTIYKEIHQVEPGQIVTFSEGTFTRKYFHQWSFSQNTSLTKYEVSDFLETFRTQITDHLISDVPVASFFSSGIDSTLITALAKETIPNITAFTLGVSDAYINEADKAKIYAEHLDLKHIISECDPKDYLKISDDHFNKLGEPFADYSSLPTYMICKEGQKHAKVMLSGDGGDELFWGYPRWQKYLSNFFLFQYPKIARRAKAKWRRLNGKSVSHGPGNFQKIEEWVLNGQSHNSSQLMETLMPGIALSDQTRSLYHFKNSSFEDFRAWLRWNEFYGHLQRVLTKVDRMSMAHSLEVRVPFLSKAMIDFSWNSHTEFGKTEFENKAMLKKALRHYLPDQLIEKRKIGFSIPLHDWLQNPLREETLDLLSNRHIYGETFLNKQQWTKRVNDFYHGTAEGDWGIWIMYAWQKWGEMLDNI